MPVAVAKEEGLQSVRQTLREGKKWGPRYIYIFSIGVPSAGRCPHLTALRGSRREIFEVDDMCRSCGSDMWLASGHHHYDVAALSDTTRGKRKGPLSGKRTSNGPPKK